MGDWAVIWGMFLKKYTNFCKNMCIFHKNIFKILIQNLNTRRFTLHGKTLGGGKSYQENFLLN